MSTVSTLRPASAKPPREYKVVGHMVYSVMCSQGDEVAHLGQFPDWCHAVKFVKAEQAASGG